MNGCCGAGFDTCHKICVFERMMHLHGRRVDHPPKKKWRQTLFGQELCGCCHKRSVHGVCGGCFGNTAEAVIQNEDTGFTLWDAINVEGMTGVYGVASLENMEHEEAGNHRGFLDEGMEEDLDVEGNGGQDGLNALPQEESGVGGGGHMEQLQKC